MTSLNLVIGGHLPPKPSSTVRSSALRTHLLTFPIPGRLNQRRRATSPVCRAAFSQDAPFAVAIGACVLGSLVFQSTSTPDDDEDLKSAVGAADTRFAVMGIISFIPYFNWLSWVFAWTDTANRRYAVYALVYLAPYLRSNLSLFSEDSWLPIASIIACIFHVQLEASIGNGDLQGFQLFSGKAKDQLQKKNTTSSSKENREKVKDPRNLPYAQEQARDEIGGWGVPGKPSRDSEKLNENEDERKH